MVNADVTMANSDATMAKAMQMRFTFFRFV